MNSINNRILILLENQAFPNDPRVRREADALVDAGYDVTVVCPTRAYAPERELTIDGVRILRFEAPPGGHGIIAYLREYLLVVARMGRILIRLRSEPRFAAVITCNPPDFLILLPRFLARGRPALVFDYHDLSPEIFQELFGRRGLFFHVLVQIERLSLRTADVVITVNQPCAEVIRGRGKVSPERVFVVANYPDSRQMYPVDPRPELRKGFAHLVLWVGSMSARAGRKEGLHLLLEAAEQLAQGAGQRTDVAFAIVGSGELWDDLAAEIRRRGLEQTVALPGEVNGDELRDYISTADVCVSLDKRSPMTDKALVMKVLEYMLVGRPVIQAPLKEMLRICGSTTVYTESGTARELAELIGELLDDPDRRTRLGQAARRRVLDGLTWLDQIPTLLEAVEQSAAVRTGRKA